MKKFIKRIFQTIGILIVLVIIATTLFMKLAPQFGGNVSKAQKAEYEKLDHYKDGKFQNYEPIIMDIDFAKAKEMAMQMISPPDNTTPSNKIEIAKFDLSTLHKLPENISRVTWLGHSSFLIEIQGKTILVDPVFGERAAPTSFAGPKKFNNDTVFSLDDLQHVDAIIISHDHYDHLDYPTVTALREKVKHVITPLAVGNHFREWDYTEEQITELDWWQETTIDDLKIVCTPSRHASGRGVLDQSSTLWSSWTIIGTHQKLYFSGDGGYGKHFAEIGAKYGPFDFGMIECGQYDHKWKDVHMTPEETVQAGLDVQAETFMPIHWGLFKLANHTWTDPIERFTKKADELNANYTTPAIGESILIKAQEYPKAKWWEKYL